MKQKVNYIQKQYEGFLGTPNLWVGNNIAGLEQFELPDNFHSIKIEKPELRLGKRVEQFVLHQLENEGFPILASNLQIRKNSETIGELDAIIMENEQPVHLEICYKYYLFDPDIKGEQIDQWIGPNRRDSFVLKLHKLKTKQFPLLQNTVTQKQLSSMGIQTENITQKVLFKAQLYLPSGFNFKNTLPIDESNIVGYYYRLNELKKFSDCKFFIPFKPDWLIEPYPQLDWLSYEVFTKDIPQYLNKKNAPLCWLKKPSGELIKFFVVWW